MNRYKETNIASILGVIGNIILMILKGIIGFISNSQAMLADFFNSFGDVFSSLMTFIGNKISSKGADEDHNLGHGKAEYIYAFLISIIMLITAFTMIKKAITTYLNHDQILFSNSLIIVSIITIIIKLLLFLYTNKIYKKYNNILIKANSKDHRNDCFITLCTLISTILGIKGFALADIIVGVLISLWIAHTAIKIFMESYDVLMDKTMSEEKKEEVYKIIEKHKEVIKVNHFNATPVGYRYQISFTIFLDGNLTTFESHEIANQLEREIHVNPVKTKD